MNGKKMTRNLFTAILSVSFVQLSAQQGPPGGGPGGGGPPQLVISGAEVSFEPEALCAPFNGGLLGISGQNLGDGSAVPTVGLFRPLDPTPGEELLTVLDYDLALNPPLLVCLPTDLETTRGDFLLRVSVGTGPHNSGSALLSIDSDTDPLNELITEFRLSGTRVEITEAGSVHNLDLAGVVTDVDVDLQNALDAEEAARITADDALQSDLHDEEAARLTADDALQNNLDSEVANRVNADAALQANLDAEAADRSAADAVLESDLDAEETARIAADDALQAQIGGGSSLDAAYDHGGAGAGRTITADAGAVRIDGSGGLELAAGNLVQSPGNPVVVGSLAVGGLPRSVYVSGRYAYVVGGQPGDLRVIDVSDPSAPSLVGSLLTGGRPISVKVSGRYAYVAEPGSSRLLVIDVSDPGAPSLVGSLGLGGRPHFVYVSGRYAYVVDFDNDELKVIDVSDPSAPSLAGSLGIGGNPLSVYVSGRYAYVADSASGDLKVIDVSDPSAPSLAGSLVIGGALSFVYVSGRYAYVTSGVLNVIDVSDPSAPSLTGSLDIGGGFVHVSGRYAYLADQGSADLKVIDVSDPSAPSLAGSLGIGVTPNKLYVSGRYAYVIDFTSDDLKVIDVSGAEVTSLVAHSLEAGNLQVRNDVIAQGQLQVTGGLNLGAGGMFSDGNVGISGTLAIANDVAPTSSPANLVQLYAEDMTTVAGDSSSELKVRDEAGNITTLSPHNFSLIGQPSEPLAWSFYSENDHGKINVDMLRAMRLLESLSGERLVHTQSDGESALETSEEYETSLKAQVEALRQKNRTLEFELARIKAVLGID